MSRFLRYTTGKVVLLKLDFHQHMLQSPVLIAQTTALAEGLAAAAKIKTNSP